MQLCSKLLIAKECEKISKMSGEIEEGESYFLLRFARNCEQKGQKECVEKGGVGLEKRHLCFYFVKPLVPLREGMLKCNRTSLYAQTLALQKNCCLGLFGA